MKFDLDFLESGKWMNAAGTAGFAPGKSFSKIFPEIGLFITNPISFNPRSPASNKTLIPFEGGFLFHTGHPNPGIRKVLQKYQVVWRNSKLPICVNLLSDDSKNLQKIVRLLEEIDNVVAIELNIDIKLTKPEINELLRVIQGEIPVILSIPYELVFQDWLENILEPGLLGVSVQAPRGALHQNDKLVHGRLYGRSVFPMIVQAVYHLSSFGLPVFGGAGVLGPDQIEKLYEAGVRNFQTHELVWRNLN